MNTKKAYEETIAAKLDVLPVPDMADAIWARIEAQLDLDLPTDDGGGNTPPSPPRPRKPWTAPALAIFTGALLSLILLFENGKKPVPTQTQVAPVSNPVTASDTVVNIPSRSSPSAPLQTPRTDGAAVPFLPDAAADSVAFNPPLQKPASDTQQVLTAAPPPVIIPDSTSKRVRGTRGINNTDYRIVPKRDSN